MRFPSGLYCLLFLLLLVMPGLAGAQVEAFAGLDSNYAETGNPFMVHLKVTGVTATPGAIDFSLWNDVAPAENRLQETEWVSMGNMTYGKDLTLVFFDADTLRLPPLNVRLANGGVTATNTLELVVMATPSPDDLNDMADIKDIRREKAIWLDYLPWALGIAALVALVILGAWLIGRAQKQKSVSSRIVERPPHELALKKLEVLAQKELWQKGLTKAYCAEITYILREYLEKRFNIPALESTSGEIINALKSTDFPENSVEGLKDVLEEADLAKFARSVPPESFFGEAFEFSKKLVSDTAQTAPEPESQYHTDQSKI